MGNNATVYKTTNAGVSWTQLTAGLGSLTGTVRSVNFVNENDGWISAQSGQIYHTSDGGSNWSAQTSNVSSNHLNSIFFLDNQTGWAVGANGGITRTTNGGTSWTGLISPINTETLRGIHFTDANNGVVVGGDRTIARSTDGGENWAYVSSVATSNLRAVTFNASQPEKGWIVGDQSQIYKTIDGGATWDSEEHSIIGTLRSVSVYDTSAVPEPSTYALGFGLLVFGFAAYRRSQAQPSMRIS